MAAVAEPLTILSPLPRADGSATYSHAGYTVTASANGPIEAQRRDEDPDEATVDVVVRPAAGVGGPSERHLESVLQKTLQEIILVQDFPRCLIQIVLQVQSAPENDYVNTRLNVPGLNLGILPALLQSAVLALISASIPMRTTATAASLAILPTPGSRAQTKIISSFSPRDASIARSTHVFAFSAQGDKLLLAESEGEFTMSEWDEVLGAARKICCQNSSADDNASEDGMALDRNTGSEDGPDMRGFLRTTVQGKLEDALKWKVARE
ncbi:exosome non-catalytic core subunit rrp46 [Sporothrix eucalyptigena]|uniref:Exosome non-catalytic core subunit rrp46 n=1 Tax=Sporothrix eucalyptigena TaxID=1812306 RepID=A0ABP0ASF4_9PEZI